MEIVVTGAAGTVGSAVLEYLTSRDDYTVIPVDITDDPNRDITLRDVREYWPLRSLFDEVDAVAHFAHIGGSPPLSSRNTLVGWFDAQRDNLKATCTVLKAAIDANVAKMIIASSIMVVDQYAKEQAPACYEPDADLMVDHKTPPKPQTPYSATKLFGEALGRVCAVSHGVSVYALRLGNIHQAELDHPYSPVEELVEMGECERGDATYNRKVAREKSIWLSRRDAGELVRACLNDDAVTYDVFYGVSDNDRRWVDIDRAKQRIGYNPQDNAEEVTELP